MPELLQPGITYSELLESGRVALQKKGIETPQLDAKILLEEASGLNAAEQISKKDEFVTASTNERFNELLKRRLNFEPVHRVIGYREFYGRQFNLSSETLIPRPDTETLVDVVLSIANNKNTPLKILELGTGSGVIAVTLACELSDVSMLTTDISKDALETARENAKVFGVSDKVSFLQTNLFDDIVGDFDFIVSNPPYIRTSELDGLSPEVRNYDPVVALDGGEDGLDFYRSIFANSGEHLVPFGALIVEIGYDQADTVSDIAKDNGFLVDRIVKDLSGHDRVLMATKN